MKLCLILLSAALLHTEAKVQHRNLALSLCTNTEKQMMYGLDGEEMWHADFWQEKGVMTLPEFADHFSYSEGTYEGAVTNMEICKQNLKVLAHIFKYPIEFMNRPKSSIYPEDHMELGSENTLICHVTGFYPPEVTVSWTRNNVKMTCEATVSRYYPTGDGTFYLISRLSFTPEEGDIYTCTVEHPALYRPLTKTWEVPVTPVPGVGLYVFFGVGIGVGLLGVAVGTFFFIKGRSFRCLKC